MECMNCVTCGADSCSQRKRSQVFFVALDAETRKPHCGEHHKGVYRAILLRAEEAGLYQPEST